MRILLINLTRLGDLLQMQPLIHTLHAQGHRVDILCLENFQEAARLLQGIETVHPFRSSRILALAADDWQSAINFLEASLEGMLTHAKYERVINMTASLAARVLALRLTAHGASVDGYVADPKEFKCSSSPWGVFFEAASNHRICSPFNIIDVFAKSAFAFAPTNQNRLIHPSNDDIQIMHHALMQTLSPAERDDCRGFVAIQLGASVAMRQWPVDAFASLGRQIWEDHKLMPVLVGSRHEHALAEAYLKTGAPACNYIGQTSLKQLAHLLCCTRLLLTNDTGTMHLAAGLEIPCLAFFLGTAQPWDTGPASTSACCLEPNLDCHPCSYAVSCTHGYRCQQHIKAEHVWPLINTWLQTGTWQSYAALNKVARVWKSTKDAKGYRNLHSLSGHEGQDRTQWLRLQHHVCHQFLDAMHSPTKKITLKITPYEHSEYPFSQDWRNLIGSHIRQSIQLCHSLLDQGAYLQREPSVAREKQFLANIRGVYSLLNALDPLSALARIWQTSLQEQAKGCTQRCLFIEHFVVALQSFQMSLGSIENVHGTKHA